MDIASERDRAGRGQNVVPEGEHTYAVAVVFHLFPVFQIHGPDMAIKQARGVRDCVCPCTAETYKSHIMRL